MRAYTFRRRERLKSEIQIKELFSKGSSFNLYPFRVIHRVFSTENSDHKVLFSVPARNFKKAVDRNKLKRRAREAYRLHKGTLNKKPALILGFVYSAKKIEPFSAIQTSVVQIIDKLNGSDVSK